MCQYASVNTALRGRYIIYSWIPLEIRSMKSSNWSVLGAGSILVLHGSVALAHDPVFGIGPHVLFKGGVDSTVELAQSKAGDDKDRGLALQAVYGITGNWSAGIDVPYVAKDSATDSSSGLSDLRAFTKYRFWREDSLGLQESAAVMLAVNGNNGNETDSPPLGNGATDLMAGLTYGYESIERYRWVSVRYLRPGRNGTGLRMGNKWLLDFVLGWRPVTPEYRKPDTVWLLELNGEITARADMNGNRIASSGGTEWFISPGIFWTYRNFAIKSGIQLPVASDLNGTQAASDYRFKASFEWHM